jgi:CheY-like chemotaxis protein
MLKMLGRLIGEDVDLLWNPGRRLGPVKMDPTQIDQVLANLVVNARDAIAGQGKITIETGFAEFGADYCATHVGFVQGAYVMLAVSDDGTGMDRETQSHIFEPFFTTKPIGRGTGLGLATVYGIVKQNNGFINVYSEPGQGTTIRIYLPLHEAEPTAVEDIPAPLEKPVGTETVLLVEDEASLLRLGRRLLEQLGYTVISSDAPEDALRLAEEFDGEIHLLVTDVVMPQMSGRDLWRRVSAMRPEIKCLYMSGYTANAISHHGILDEGIHFLQKPFDVDVLARKIREVLEG